MLHIYLQDIDMPIAKKRLIFNIFSLIFILMISACDKPKSSPNVSAGSQNLNVCSGTTISSNNRYLKAKTTVPLGNGDNGYFDIYVQRLTKTGINTWTDTPAKTLDNGLTPCQTLKNIQSMWQEFYSDMISTGIHPDVVANYVSSISAYSGDPARSQAGIYAESYLGACGYAGAAGTITCGLGFDEGFKRFYLAHENTHGFQWDWSSGADESILLYRIFASYANALYHQSVSDSSQFVETGGAWSIALMDYALQNEAEWLSEVFRDYLYPGTGHWTYIQTNHTELANYLNCVWKQGGSFQSCQTSTNVPTISFADSVPVVDLPMLSGFGTIESEAIWNVCFASLNKNDYMTSFELVINTLTPGKYSNSADKFILGYGDCDHNGVIDWICSYKGSAPDGSSYLWNSNNQTGTYTFIASGDSSTNYAEYKQDPFLTLPTINGSLAQPMYREWQGNNGSCNGARYFNQVPKRFPIFSSQVSNLPAEYANKINW